VRREQPSSHAPWRLVLAASGSRGYRRSGGDHAPVVRLARVNVACWPPTNELVKVPDTMGGGARVPDARWAPTPPGEMDQLVNPNESDSSVSAVAAVSLMAGLVRPPQQASPASIPPARSDQSCAGCHPVGAQPEARTLAYEARSLLGRAVNPCCRAGRRDWRPRRGHEPCESARTRSSGRSETPSRRGQLPQRDRTRTRTSKWPSSGEADAA
jgi:hypothetical protein